MKCVGFLSHSIQEMMSLSMLGSASFVESSYSIVWIGVSGERASCVLILMERGENFNITHPGQVRKRCLGPGHARDLEL